MSDLKFVGRPAEAIDGMDKIMGKAISHKLSKSASCQVFQGANFSATIGL